MKSPGDEYEVDKALDCVTIVSEIVVSNTRRTGFRSISRLPNEEFSREGAVITYLLRANCSDSGNFSS